MKSFCYWTLLGFLFVGQLGCQDKSESVVPKSDSTNPATEDSTNDSVTANDSDANQSNEILIDVRTQQEWGSGHLEQAIHIPHDQIPNRIAEITTDKTAKLVLY
ncbi:MAG: rhodanese-like domain-containing protein [Planctomycetota bacterium]